MYATRMRFTALHNTLALHRPRNHVIIIILPTTTVIKTNYLTRGQHKAHDHFLTKLPGEQHSIIYSE